MDIKTITTEKLLEDRRESVEDVGNCRLALDVGVKEYSGGSVKARLETNERIIKRIDAEIQRRSDG